MRPLATITLLAAALLLLLPAAAHAQVTIDGVLDEDGYQTLATKQNDNNGFGDTNNLTEVVYSVNTDEGILYLGVKGVLEGNGNGFGIFLNFGEVSGTPAGTPLGFDESDEADEHFFDGDGGANADFAADFEVDYMLAAANNGGESLLAAASKVGGNSDFDLIGTSDISGSSVMGPSEDNASFLSEESVTFALDNSETGSTGLEVAIPFDELNVTSAGDFEAFAVIVSGTGFFAGETAPGDFATGNPGNNPDFSSLDGGPYNSEDFTLPVELTGFTAQADGEAALLQWQTASETNNQGFYVEQQTARGWDEIGFREGAGTSGVARRYAFRTEALAPGAHTFRLRQVDFDGTPTLSESRTVTLADAYALHSVAPNPFAGQATVRFTTPEPEAVTVALYNMLGQQVRTLFDGRSTRGMNTVALRGADLASGLYIVRVQGRSFSETQAVTLVK